MHFDATIAPANLNAAAELARRVEAAGFAGLWTTETAHNPFLPLTHAASATQRILLGTAIAVAFPRSPMITAQIAWDLAAQSNGRFVLGLGTQVKPHIEKRFSATWSAPAPRLREYIESLRAIWCTFQEGHSLRYAGEHYKFTLMTPFFNPGAIAHPNIPIYIAGVNAHLCQLAGELCQGFHVHPFHTLPYLQQVIIPNIEAGAARTGRARADCALSCAIFVVTGRDADEMAENSGFVRSQIAFYASTPSYSPVMALHGWHELHQRLNQMSREGRWLEMGALISDDILHQFAVVAPLDELAHAVKARYNGWLDRIGYYYPFDPDDTKRAPLWKDAITLFN
jgi:probable F420-dependent oxidoreductase